MPPLPIVSQHMKPLVHLTFCAALLALSCLEADAQNRKRVPRFEDYPVKEIYTGKTAPLALDTEDQRSSSTYYQAIADGGTSFAGHYAIVMLSCGTNCSAIEYLDTESGKLLPSEITNSGWKQIHDGFRDIEFRRASRLIVFAGEIDQKRPSGWHFFLFTDGKLKRLPTIVTRGDFRKPLRDWMK